MKDADSSVSNNIDLAGYALVARDYFRDSGPIDTYSKVVDGGQLTNRGQSSEFVTGHLGPMRTEYTRTDLTRICSKALTGVSHWCARQFVLLHSSVARRTT